MAAPGKKNEPRQKTEAEKQAIAPRRGSVNAGTLIVVNILAVVFALVILVMQFIMVPDSIWSLGLGAVGFIFAALAVFFPLPSVATPDELARRQGDVTLKEIFLLGAIVFFVLAAGMGPVMGQEFIAEDITGSEGLGTYFGMLSLILVYGVAFLLFIEYAYASLRYSKIKQYAEVQGLDGLELNPVLTSYIGVSFVLAGGAMLVTFLVFIASKAVSMYIPSEALRASIEFNSIYGVTIAASVIFGLIGIIYTFVFGWEGFQKMTKSFEIEEEED